MINYHKTLVAALSDILPTYHESFLHSGLETPCISYMEMENAAQETGDTLGYSRLSYTVKVWGKDMEQLQQYAMAIDAALRLIGFKRISCNELSSGTMIQKIMSFEAKAKETY